MAAPPRIDSDERLVARAVADLGGRTRFPVVFGGLEHDGAIHVTAVHGARTHHIDGLVVQTARGLGGAAHAEGRPRLALDYRTSRSITHDYDRAILGEGITTLFAVPVMVAGRSRGVVYCGSWQPSTVGDGMARPVFGAVESLATELRVREEVDRRLSALPPPSTSAPGALPSSAREILRESYAELRSIAASVADAGIRARLDELERRLASLSAPADESPGEPEPSLSRRELDVLACCAVGSTNAEIAATLGLREVTVKSYLAAAMAKLDASTRHAAVARARRAGLLP